METNKVHFKFVSQIKDDANAHHAYAISKPLRSTDIISIAQPFSDAIKFFFPIQMLNGRNEVYFYMQFT